MIRALGAGVVVDGVVSDGVVECGWCVDPGRVIGRYSLVVSPRCCACLWHTLVAIPAERAGELISLALGGRQRFELLLVENGRARFDHRQCREQVVAPDLGDEVKLSVHIEAVREYTIWPDKVATIPCRTLLLRDQIDSHEPYCWDCNGSELPHQAEVCLNEQIRSVHTLGRVA